MQAFADPHAADEPPATVEPYVRAIGSAAAVELLMSFGGATIYVSAKPRGGSPLVTAIGPDAAAALFREFGTGHLRVPMAKGWIARQLDREGVARPEIARRLRVTRESVRRYLVSARKVAA